MPSYTVFSVEQAQRIARTVRAHEGKQKNPGGKQRLLPVPSDTPLTIVNTTGEQLSAGQVLGIGLPVTTPSDDLDTFLDTLAVDGHTPAVPADTGSFAVLLQDCPDYDVEGNEGVAMCCAMGVCRVQVNYTGDQDTANPIWCDVASGVNGYLVPVAGGTAEVLWREGGSGVQWAIVRLGSGASGPMLAQGYSNTEIALSTDVIIAFDWQVFSGSFDTSSSTALGILTAGVYELTWSATLYGLNTTDIGVFLNGDPIAGFYGEASSLGGSIFCTVSGTWLLSLNVGDTIGLGVPGGDGACELQQAVLAVKKVS